MATTAEQLTSVQKAIAAIEGGAQSYQVDGRALSRGDLRTLYERERELLARLQREARGGGMRLRYIVPL